MAFVLAGSATAATINVSPGTNAIKNAINTANTGDTLNLSAGIYQEHDLNIDKNLTITGPTTSDKITATIDAQKQGRAFKIKKGVKLTLKYLRIENGDATKNTDLKYGGAIQNQGTLTIKTCKITKNNATSGGGIYNYNIGTCTVISSIINNNTAQFSGGILNDGGTFTVESCNINSNTATEYCGGISNYFGTCTVNSSNIKNNTAEYSGGIYNYKGTFIVNSSNIKNNTANYNGGGILIDGGTFTVESCNINSNTAKNGDGGGISNYNGTFTVNSSDINSNTAYYNGGGISNYNGTCTVTGCDFEYNKAINEGNAIYNDGGTISDRVVHFCRFYDPSVGYEICSKSGAVDAQFNWWGSNENPSSKVYGNVDITPWLVLNISATPTLIGKNLKSTITVDITHDSSNGTHSLTNGPNHILITLNTSLGGVNSPVSTFNGVANATLTAETTAGIAYISALLDDEIVNTSVTIETTTPSIITSDPKNGATKVARNKNITVTFNENIKTGTNYSKITLKSSSGKTITITKSISGKVLTIKHSSKFAAKTKYILTLYSGCVKDLAGNPLAAKTITFTTGST